MFRPVLCAVVVLAAARARADGIAIVGGSPRAIGRAGAATLGDDGGGALLINPAAMARRDTSRAQLGANIVDDDVRWQTDARGGPLSRGQAGSRIAPLAAAVAGVGDWVIGAGVMTAAVSERSLARPVSAINGDLGSNYDYRYAGIAGGYRRDTLAIGAARRIGSSLALGLSLGAAQVRVSEQRRLWAGSTASQTLGDFHSDVDVALSGVDRFTESAVAGLLYAPEDSQIELGASVSWMRSVKLSGALSAATSASDSTTGPTVIIDAPAASLEVKQPLAVRVGGRFVGDRIVAELDGDLWIAPSGSALESWSVRGLKLVDPSGDSVDVAQVPSRISQHTHAAGRVAIDVELIPGFLWATGGYALSTMATPADRLSPTFGDLGGQTFGLGLEATAGSVTVTLGWSHTWDAETKAPTSLTLDNPFATGNGPVPAGTYDGSLDQVGVLVEVELSHPTR